MEHSRRHGSTSILNAMPASCLSLRSIGNDPDHCMANKLQFQVNVTLAAEAPGGSLE
jgi:hypothetical protein